MKKLLAIFLLLMFFIIMANIAFGQTITVKKDTVTAFASNGDTLLNITTTTTATTKLTVQIVKPFKPIITPADSLKALVITKNQSTQEYHKGQTGITITGLHINMGGGSAIAMLIQNCTNVIIKDCIIENTLNDGIQLSGCNNVEVTRCLIMNTKAGINALYSQTINVHNCQFLNMNGPFPSGNFVQFDNVNGKGCRINYNRCEDIFGIAKKPEDGLSVYQSNGLLGDSIQVIGNLIRGGQYYNTSGGAAGIVLGDVGGSYQVARNNIVVNGGFVGMQVQGGIGIKMDHNLIYSIKTAYSNCGLCFGNYSGKPCSSVYMGYNQIKFFNKNGVESDSWWDPSSKTYPAFQPAGWNTNILKANLDPLKMLPLVIITWI